MNDKKVLPVHYRYSEGVFHDGFHIYEDKFYPIRETPCYYWCLDEHFYRTHKNGTIDYSDRAKRISKNGVRRKAYPCKKQALESYKKRKESQLRHARDAINIATYALKQLDGVHEIKTFSNYGMQSACLGTPEFMENYIFD